MYEILKNIINLNEEIYENLSKIINYTQNAIDFGEFNEAFYQIREIGNEWVRTLRTIETLLGHI